MTPLHAATLPAITAIVRRHYLRPATLVPVPGDPDRWDPDRWDIVIPGRREPMTTEVVLTGDVYTFQRKPVRSAPDWDREIEGEHLTH